MARSGGGAIYCGEFVKGRVLGLGRRSEGARPKVHALGRAAEIRESLRVVAKAEARHEGGGGAGCGDGDEVEVRRNLLDGAGEVSKDAARVRGQGDGAGNQIEQDARRTHRIGASGEQIRPTKPQCEEKHQGFHVGDLAPIAHGGEGGQGHLVNSDAFMFLGQPTAGAGAVGGAIGT